MNIFLSEQLRKLRKEKGNTQEDLAEHLGITMQAVSKWEREEGYPDITLLPAIEAFYNVSIDDLLGVGKIEKEKKLREYSDQNAELFRAGKTSERVALWREAQKEFPNDLSVLHDLMYALLIPDAARKGEMLWMKFDPDNIPEQMRSGPMRIGKRYVTYVIDVETLPTITQYTGNVLIIHGDKDTLVNIAGSENSKEAYLAAGADVRMEIIEGGKHIFLKPKHINTAKSFVAEFAKRIKAQGE